MHHIILKRKKRLVEGFESFKREKIRQWVFGTLYGLLNAEFWGIISAVSDVNFSSFCYYVMCNVVICQHFCQQYFYFSLHSIAQICTTLQKVVDVIHYVLYTYKQLDTRLHNITPICTALELLRNNYRLLCAVCPYFIFYNLYSINIFYLVLFSKQIYLVCKNTPINIEFINQRKHIWTKFTRS